MDKFKEIIRQYPFLGFIIAFIILMLVPSVFFTDLYQSHLASLICINIIVAAGLSGMIAVNYSVPIIFPVMGILLFPGLIFAYLMYRSSI